MRRKPCFDGFNGRLNPFSRVQAPWFLCSEVQDLDGLVKIHLYGPKFPVLSQTERLEARALYHGAFRPQAQHLAFLALAPGRALSVGHDLEHHPKGQLHRIAVLAQAQAGMAQGFGCAEPVHGQHIVMAGSVPCS